MKKYTLTILLILVFSILALGMYAYQKPNPQQEFNTSYEKPKRIIIKCTAEKICIDSIDFEENKVVVEGQVRGTWSFEGSFPVDVLLSDGSIINTFATIDGDWMTEEFVKFSTLVALEPGILPFEITFKKDNPSGLPENDDSFTQYFPTSAIPIHDNLPN